MEQIRENVQFLLDAVRTYTQSNKIWLLLPICLLLVLIFDKKKRSVFFWPFVIFAVGICNPLWVNILVDRFGFSNRYHRFFWMIPFYALVAYCMTRLVCVMKHKISRALMTVMMVLVIIVLGDSVFFSQEAPDYQLAVNEYGVSNDVLQLYDIFHGDNIENPIVLYDQWGVLNYRQYDPSVISYISRSNTIKYGAYTREQAQTYLEKKNYKNKQIILMAGYLEYQDLVDDYALMNALVEEDISYVVVNKNNWAKRALYDSYQFPCEGETDTYVVYRN